MNTFQPAAHVRAVTGFRESKAGTRSIVQCAWNRSLLWLLVRFLPVVMLTCMSGAPAHANGVTGTIGNGQTVNGTIISSGFDNYSFKVMEGSSFVVSIGEAGVHDESFAPEITIVTPGTGDVRGSARPLHTRIEEINVAAGTYTVTVSRHKGGTTGGTYALTLIQIPGGFSAPGGVAAVPMSPGAAYSVSNVRGNLGVFTFTGMAGHTATLTLNQNTQAGFTSEISVYTPTGGFAGRFACPASCNQDVSLTMGGIYTVVVSKFDDNDITGTYTLSLNDKT